MIFGPFRASFGTIAESHEQYSVLAGSWLSHKAIKSRCAKHSLRLFPYLPSAHVAEAIILAATRVRMIPIISWFVTTYQSGIFVDIILRAFVLYCLRTPFLIFATPLYLLLHLFFSWNCFRLIRSVHSC